MLGGVNRESTIFRLLGGEYKILPLPKSRQKLTNVIMDGRQLQGNATIKQKQNHLYLWVHVMGVAPILPIVTWAG